MESVHRDYLWLIDKNKVEKENCTSYVQLL